MLLFSKTCANFSKKVFMLEFKGVTKTAVVGCYPKTSGMGIDAMEYAPRFSGNRSTPRAMWDLGLMIGDWGLGIGD